MEQRQLQSSWCQRPGVGNVGGAGALPGDLGDRHCARQQRRADGEACKAVVQQAEKQSGKADLVFVLDNSGSRAQEVAAVQSNLNAFSSQIEASGIDVHVVVISAPPSGTAGGRVIRPASRIFVPGLTTNGLLNGNGFIDPLEGGRCLRATTARGCGLALKQGVDSPMRSLKPVDVLPVAAAAPADAAELSSSRTTRARSRQQVSRPEWCAGSTTGVNAFKTVFDSLAKTVVNDASGRLPVDVGASD
jgi:hypothetical protein